MSEQVYTIILNSNNKSSDNSFTYDFPAPVKMLPSAKIALQSISMYNSIFNIEASRLNNKISIIWNADTSVQHDFVITDGNYSISDLNYLLQFYCVENDLYLLDTNENKNKYFLEIVVNSNIYGCQINSYALPTAATAATLNLTKPAGATWDFPTSAKAPQIVFGSQFGSLIGFEGSTYPTGIETVDTNIRSSKTPQIAPVNSILVGCNLIHSELSTPVDLFYSFSLNSAFGALIEIKNTSLVYNSIRDGLYKNIVISLYDQAFNNLKLHDYEVVVVLSIKMDIK